MVDEKNQKNEKLLPEKTGRFCQKSSADACAGGCELLVKNGFLATLCDCRPIWDPQHMYRTVAAYGNAVTRE
jgi:hypothetical protein